MNIKNLHKALSLNDDDIVDCGTLTALFEKLGVPHTRAEELALAASVHMGTYHILENDLIFIS